MEEVEVGTIPELDSDGYIDDEIDWASKEGYGFNGDDFVNYMFENYQEYGRDFVVGRMNSSTRYISNLLDKYHSAADLLAIKDIPWAAAGRPYRKAGDMIYYSGYIFGKKLPIRKLKSSIDSAVYCERYIDQSRKTQYKNLVSELGGGEVLMWSKVEAVYDLLAEKKNIRDLMQKIIYKDDQRLGFTLINDFLHIVAETIIKNNEKGDLSDYLAPILVDSYPVDEYTSYLNLLRLVLYVISVPSKLIEIIDDERESINAILDDTRAGIVGYPARFDQLVENVLKDRLKIEPYREYVRRMAKSMYPDDNIYPKTE